MESNLRRTWAEIDFNALKHNYETLRKTIGEKTRFLGVVKADAYGHGAVQVASWLEELGADYLAVSSADEAMELRLNGISMPILILGHTPKEHVPELIDYNITQAITCESKALEYSEEAVRHGGTLKVHIKVDTGMSRLGYICDRDYFETGVGNIVRSVKLPGLETEGIFTHFAVSDEPENPDAVNYTIHQFNLFTHLIDAVENEAGMHFEIKHCANTGAVASYPEFYLDMVRPGLLLYGYGESAKALGLLPVMTLKTTVSTIKIYPPDTRISYGGVFRTEDTTVVGVLPYGYADGFMRCLSNRCTLMTKDGPVPQIGRICMDMCMIDLSDKENIDVGDEIEIFGKNNPIENISDAACTIPYELTCAVSKRVPRLYMKDGEVVMKELLLRGNSLP